MQLYDRRALLFSAVVLCVVFALGMCNTDNSAVHISSAFQDSLFGGILAFMPAFVGSSFGFRLRPLGTPEASHIVLAALLFIALSVYVLLTLLPEGQSVNWLLWGSALWGVVGSFVSCYGLTYFGPARNA